MLLWASPLTDQVSRVRSQQLTKVPSKGKAGVLLCMELVIQQMAGQSKLSPKLLQ